MVEIQNRLTELKPHRADDIVLHCRHGGRSLHVANWLRQQGVSIYEGSKHGKRDRPNGPSRSNRACQEIEPLTLRVPSRRSGLRPWRSEMLVEPVGESQDVERHREPAVSFAGTDFEAYFLALSLRLVNEPF